jgi:hypothetical protein
MSGGGRGIDTGRVYTTALYFCEFCESMNIGAVLKFLRPVGRRRERGEVEALCKELRRTRKEVERACRRGDTPDECIAKVEEAVRVAEELRRRTDCNDAECAEMRAALDKLIQALNWYMQFVKSLR